MKQQKTGPGFWRRFIGGIIIVLCVLYLLLLIPEKDFEIPTQSDTSPFLWDQDELWAMLEKLFQNARATGCSSLADSIDAGLKHVQRKLDDIAKNALPPDAEVFDTLETWMFHLAARTAACPSRLSNYIAAFSSIRTTVKNQSWAWDIKSVKTRQKIYRLLYGGRAAVEEIMLQAPRDEVPALIIGESEPSATPKSTLLGITVHSGDILVSRGGAPTSALIARGNDYPGNFSHVALLHVDEETREASIIESHIESGVGVSTIEQYLGDEKLRVMVLRLRADLPAIESDPLLPHKAASAVLYQAQNRQIPYDFEMDFGDYEKYFCSEVASAPYHDLGISLWMGISRMSSMKLRIWLAALGVRHFETQEPSDLEYDPQLRVVAEWRDPEKLYKDHLDNAVLDAMLEGSDSTETLDYDWYALPVARCIKAYSVIKNIFGSVGPIPEGMSATAALRIDKFSQKHRAIKADLVALAAEFREEQGYTPPYWVLVDFARKAKGAFEVKGR